MGLLTSIIDGIAGSRNQQAVKAETVKKGYVRSRPSMPDNLAITDFSDKHNVFLLEDGLSLGSGFELGDIAAESASDERIEAVFKRVVDVFSYVVPLHEKNPWVMQLYVGDEFSLESTADYFEACIDEPIRKTEYTQEYLRVLRDLYQKLTRPEGLFFDPMSDAPFRGRLRRIRTVFYRRYSEQDKKNPVTRAKALKEHLSVRRRIQRKLSNAGLDVRLLEGSQYYHWFLRWFNPSPSITQGNVDKLIKTYPYSKENKPASFNFGQNIFFSYPETSKKNIYFDGEPHRVLFFDGLSKPPKIGGISREIEDLGSKKRYALLDKLPEGAVYTMQVVFSDDSALEKHLSMIQKGTIGASLEARRIREDIQTARDEMSAGNRLYWVTSALYLRAKNDEALDEMEEELTDLFGLDAGMPLIPSKFEVHPIDSYLSLLPFNFNYDYFKKYLKYDRLMYATEMGALMPVYGRNKGAKHLPCFPFFNRVGEPVSFDILHREFVAKNSHMAIFADTGGGKSVIAGQMVNSLLAVKNARVVLFEMGNSFGGLIEHAKKKGKKVSQVVFKNDASKAVPINPFVNWDKALDEVDVSDLDETIKKQVESLEELRESRGEAAKEEDLECADKRSYLTELSLGLRTMLTQANEKEEENFSLFDETLILEILSDALVECGLKQVPQMLTEHVVQAFERRMESEESPRKRDRIEEFHGRLKSYVIGEKARFFNTPAKKIEDFDLFHIDIESIKDDKAKIGLVMISLLPKIITLAEETLNQGRPMFLFIDEAHLQLQIPVVLDYTTLIAKVARKLGLWLVVITQNTKDLSSEKAKKILSLCETMIVLGLNEDEIKNIKNFKPITKEEEHLIRNINSVKGVYTEAMLLGANYQGLFRVIPPRQLLALLMNEQSEKVWRGELEEKYGADKAIEIMAESLENKVSKESDDSFFLGN